MFRRRNVLLLLVSCSFSIASPLTDWRDAFQAGELPAREELLGLWAGRCAESSAPDRPFPALYAYREMGAKYDSHSHYLNRTAGAPGYEDWTLSQAQADSSIKGWQAGESWPSVFENSNSVQNIFREGQSSSRVRAVRRHQGSLYLQISANSAGGGLLSACQFTRKLADTPALPANLIADSGAQDGGFLKVANRDPKSLYRGVQVVNDGTEPVELTNLQVKTAAGWLVVPETLRLDARGSAAFVFADKPETLDAVACFVSGRTPNLRFLGITR